MTTKYYIISLDFSGVTPGTYTNPTLTVDKVGRVTYAVSNQSSSSSQTTPVHSSSDLTAEKITYNTFGQVTGGTSLISTDITSALGYTPVRSGTGVGQLPSNLDLSLFSFPNNTTNSTQA